MDPQLFLPWKIRIKVSLLPFRMSLKIVLIKKAYYKSRFYSVLHLLFVKIFRILVTNFTYSTQSVNYIKVAYSTTLIT